MAVFPALAWALIHPLALIGAVTEVEHAISVLLAVTVAAGIVYLWSLHVWLRAEGCSTQARAAALMVAGAAIPFVTLYSDIAEVQIPAAVVVAALATCRMRFAAGRGGDGTMLATVAAIALASLVYQALALALLFVPLVVPLDRIRRPRVLLAAAAIALCVPVMLIGGRVAAGDELDVAVLTTFAGERGALVRSAMSRPALLKWAAALVAGPPQAIVGLWKFQGLSLLAEGLRAGDPASMLNFARLMVGVVLFAVLGWAVLRVRDWRLVIAALAVVAVPVLRNQQYTYAKFFVLWPVVLALASVKLRPRHAAAAAALILTLNSSLLARHVAEGRHRYSDASRVYRTATSNDCFFTTDWGAPFPYLWPGSDAALISIFWAMDEQAAGADRMTAAMRGCFCESQNVWTNATVEASGELTRLTGHFGYAEIPVTDFLFRPGDGSAVDNSARIFVYSAERQAGLCAVARR